MIRKPLLVTCGLPYTNGPCHLGHLRTYVPADFYVRYLRRAGEEVVFICGSDNHGTPVVVSAEEAGVSPRSLAEKFHLHLLETFRRVNVIFDHFGMTDDPTNHRRTQAIMNTLINNGYIYSKVVHQSYCTKCKRFLPDRYVEGLCPHCSTPARGDECDQGCGRHLEPGEIKEPTCTVCGTRAEFRDQEHYFFKLSEFKAFLLSYLDTVHGTSNARNYALGWVTDELHDWCVTRTLDWGVKFPGREDLVVYVWVDAPIGYISFTEEWAKKQGKDWKDYWCGDTQVTHFIGGDIIYHHGIFWPALLKGAGYGIPHSIVASGMVKVDDHKFSKSRGYVVWTNEDYLDKGLSPDYLRYYLLSYTNHTKELNFSWKVFQERVNNELVNTLGNFIYRTLYFAHKEYGGIPSGQADTRITDEITKCLTTVDSAVRQYEFKNAVDAMMGLAAFGNIYIQTNAPWKLIKTDTDEAGKVIRNCLQIVKALALIIEPVMPDKAGAIWSMLGYKDNLADHPVSESVIGLTPGKLEPPKPLFEKIDDTLLNELDTLLASRVLAAGTPVEKIPEITIEDFSALDIRTGTIISAEAVPKSSKLLKLQVDIGTETRQIVSGISQFYKPCDLVGKTVVVLVNLKSAKIFGIESRGMVLAAGDTASLLKPETPVGPGTKIR
ncbi:MAG: methionine--tRNA ligase [Methanomicrobiales archaeon]|nr:methionine--tRNA ligase [Methanomicrobiales archaeon]